MQTRIREVRKARGLTLAEVAARCSPPTTAQTIGRLETGMRTVSIGWLRRIAEAMRVPSSELITLPNRSDLPVVALLGANGAIAPARQITLAPPTPTLIDFAVQVETSLGDYRAGDRLWLTRLPPVRFGEALNRDVLIPRGKEKFYFGRLMGSDGMKTHLLPLLPGTRQIVIAQAPWLGMVTALIREF